MKPLLINIKEHSFYLSTCKTIYWENKKTLLISDLHLGKAEHFINNFIPLPYNIEKDLNRFRDAVNEFNVSRILILGDLFHAKTTVDKELFKQFLLSLNKKVTLILGNHDILDVNTYKELGINKVYKSLTEDMFLFTHKPVESDLINIHGHIHPGIILRGIANQKLKLPCFYFTEKYLCLPAFGGLTGKHTIIPSKNTKVYIVTDKLVKKVS